jgi:hypothetical protein
MYSSNGSLARSVICHDIHELGLVCEQHINVVTITAFNGCHGQQQTSTKAMTFVRYFVIGIGRCHGVSGISLMRGVYSYK